MKQSARELIECGIRYIRPEDSYAVGSTVLKAFRNKIFIFFLYFYRFCHFVIYYFFIIVLSYKYLSTFIAILSTFVVLSLALLLYAWRAARV